MEDKYWLFGACTKSTSFHGFQNCLQGSLYFNDRDVWSILCILLASNQFSTYYAHNILEFIVLLLESYRFRLLDFFMIIHYYASPIRDKHQGLVVYYYYYYYYLYCFHVHHQCITCSDVNLLSTQHN